MNTAFLSSTGTWWGWVGIGSRQSPWSAEAYHVQVEVHFEICHIVLKIHSPFLWLLWYFKWRDINSRINGLRLNIMMTLFKEARSKTDTPEGVPNSWLGLILQSSIQVTKHLNVSNRTIKFWWDAIFTEVFKINLCLIFCLLSFPDIPNIHPLMSSPYPLLSYL